MEALWKHAKLKSPYLALITACQINRVLAHFGQSGIPDGPPTLLAGGYDFGAFVVDHQLAVGGGSRPEAGDTCTGAGSVSCVGAGCVRVSCVGASCI